MVEIVGFTTNSNAAASRKYGVQSLNQEVRHACLQLPVLVLVTRPGAV